MVTRHARHGAVRGAALLLAAGTLIATAGTTATGCANVFGFDHSILRCLRQSDCALGQACFEGVCLPECNDARDCRDGYVCTVAHTCVAPADASVNDAPADSAPAPEASEGDDGPACDPPCSPFSMCKNSVCLDFQRYGYTGRGPSSQYADRGIIIGIQVPLSVCGYVTGIGFVNVGDPHGVHFRFGVYTDNGGLPDVLIAETPVTALQSGLNEVLVSTPAPLVCSGGVSYYWLLGLWDTDPIDFAAESTPVDNWIYAPALVGDVFQQGLPGRFPVPGFSIAPAPNQPHLYVIATTSQ
jgi:hypothetical protein